MKSIDAKPETQLEYNYYKLLEQIKGCYEENLSRLEIPFSCAKDYPKDLCYRLQKISLDVDITKQSILIKIPTKKV